MNKKKYLATATALVIVATWLIYLRASTASMTRDNISLEKKLHSSGNSTDTLSADERTKKPQAGNSDALVTSTAWIDTSRDWKKLALVLLAEGEAQGNSGKQAAWLRLQTLLAEMSEDELMAAYHEINVLPARPIDRWHLEDELLKNLELKNPEFAFSQHIARFEDNDKLTRGIGRFHLWLERDPAAATAWYESEVAKGTFEKALDGYSRLRLPFEAGFIGSLLASDPAASESRMSKIPPEQRKGLVISYLEVSKSDPKALIDLIRKTVRKEEQAELVVLEALDLNHLRDSA